MVAEMWCVRLSPFVTVCYEELRLRSTAVQQCPPSAIVPREVNRWCREAPRQTQTTQPQLMKEPFPLPSCSSACPHTLAWYGYEACDNCCENRIARNNEWRFNEQSMFAWFQHLSEVGKPGEDEPLSILLSGLIAARLGYLQGLVLMIGFVEYCD